MNILEVSLDIQTIIEENIPFNRFLGLKVQEIRPRYARLELPFRPEFIGDPRRPALHGGIIATLVDTCAGAAVWASGSPRDRVATIDMRVDYLRPADPANLVAIGIVKLLGNRVGNAVVQVFSVNNLDLVIAEGRGVFNIRKAGAKAPCAIDDQHHEDIPQQE
jgi:uncharacterized protein (TIGR00369 family)